MSAERLIGEIATARQGCVTRAQMIAAGVSRAQIASRVRSGMLLRRFRGVYVLAHDAPIPFQEDRAALLATGDGACLVRRSAAHGWGLLHAPPEVVELTVPGSRGRSRTGIRFYSGERLDPRDVTHYRGLPVTSIPQLLLDLAGEGETDLAARLLTEARVKRLLTDATLDAFLERTQGRRGRPALLSVLRGPDASMTRSEAERLLRSLVRRAKLPQPLVNRVVLGSERDFAWLPQAFAVETDGFASHGTRASFEEDRRKDAELTAAGWGVLRITWRKLTEEPEWVVARIAVSLAIRGWTPNS